MKARRNCKVIKLGNVLVGGNNPITVQSMTKTDTRDAAATVAEIKRLAKYGCDIIRLAVPDAEAANSMKKICELSPIPVIADIHFDHKLALSCIANGVHGLRLNPGNIRREADIASVAAAAKDAGIPIRVGVNAGSLDPDMKEKYGGVTGEALAESALKEASLLERYGFEDIKIAVKSFDLETMYKAVEIVAEKCNYPLHLGVTESGLPEEGIIRSSIGISHLLMQGIGDTIRVSLTGDSAEEVKTGINILNTLGLRQSGITIVSCPTCGRTEIPLIKIAQDVKERLSVIKTNKPLQVAVMGCVVNGPGEAEQADFGLAGGKDCGIIFRKGKVIKKLPTEQLAEALEKEIRTYLNN